MDDLISRQAAIDVEGLDAEIRCEMCRNPMHTARGCDGNCKYDERLYERIMQVLAERIKPLPSAQPEVLAHGEGVLNTQHDNDRIWEALSNVYNMDGVPDEAKAIIGDVMLGLDEPSAQPEIVRCKDCRYHILQDGRCRLWCQFVDPLEWCSRAKRKDGEAE